MSETTSRTTAASWASSARRRWSRWRPGLAERRLLLLLGDLLVAIAVTLLALWGWALAAGTPFSINRPRAEPAWFYLFPPAWLLLNANLYSRRNMESRTATVRSLVTSAALMILVYLGIFFFSPRGALPRLVVVYFILGAFALSLAWRMTYITVFVSPYFQHRALVVGAGWAGQTITRVLIRLQPRQYAIVGLIDDDPGTHGQLVGGVPVLGGYERLATTAQAYGVSEIVLAITGEIQGALFQALLDCQAQGIPVVRMPLLYEQLTGRIPIEHLSADWMIGAFMDKARVQEWFYVSKRLLDLCGAVVGLLLLAIVTPIVAVVVWLESGGPIFYWQDRLGKGGRLFLMPKFRTMIQEAEADGRPRWATPDDERVTAVGRFLRRSRLDEAPQLWSVMRGEMSLVGPRPERPEFIASLEKQIPFYRARLEVKPGITGWAQVNYGYGATVEDAAIKLQYDLYYIKHQSLWLDLLILTRTVGVVLRFTGT
ncbi:MAG: sugar transferase [Anaerolineales bacterium]